MKKVIWISLITLLGMISVFCLYCAISFFADTPMTGKVSQIAMAYICLWAAYLSGFIATACAIRTFRKYPDIEEARVNMKRLSLKLLIFLAIFSFVFLFAMIAICIVLGAYGFKDDIFIIPGMILVGALVASPYIYWLLKIKCPRCGKPFAGKLFANWGSDCAHCKLHDENHLYYSLAFLTVFFLIPVCMMLHLNKVKDSDLKIAQTSHQLPATKVLSQPATQ